MTDTSLQYNIELLKARQRELARMEIHTLLDEWGDKVDDVYIDGAVALHLEEGVPLDEAAQNAFEEWKGAGMVRAGAFD